MWYCAHGTFYYKLQVQESFLVHENVYVIEASDEKQARALAEEVCREAQDLNEEGSLEVNGTPAQYIFMGIRKIVQVETNPGTAQGKLESGTEATYSIMEVDSMEDVEALARGHAVNVLYRE